MTITTEQRKQIREHLGTFPFVSSDLADRIADCADHFKIGAPSQMIWDLFAWSTSAEGYLFWNSVESRFVKEEQKLLHTVKVEPKQKELTQADVQSLLNIVRSDLEFATNHKEGYKHSAAETWKHCHKDDVEQGQEFFDAFSTLNSSHKRMKQREKTLVGLITKLKALR